MSRRSSPRKKVDDPAFPLRVLIKVPTDGSVYDAIHAWLRLEVGHGDYAVHSATGVGVHAIALYFRDFASAAALFRAFPGLELEDGTQSIAYSTSLHWSGSEVFGVCNLYSAVKGQAAIRALFDDIKDQSGNLPPLPGIYPDQQAPVVANTDEGRVLTMMRWGMPSPAFALKNRNYDRGVTNVRNTRSPHWRRWLAPRNRCVVPFTSFSEPDVHAGKGGGPVWFALGEDRPLAFFTGIWTPWTSIRKIKDGETTDNLFGFLTTDPNAVVAPIHPKAMPVILTARDEIEAWLTAPIDEALELQRPLADDALVVVGRGAREDDAGFSQEQVKLRPTGTNASMHAPKNEHILRNKSGV